MDNIKPKLFVNFPTFPDETNMSTISNEKKMM